MKATATQAERLKTLRAPVRKSPAAVTLNRILAMAVEVEELTRDFVAEHLDGECDCPFCRWAEGRAPGLEDDGMLFPSDVAESIRAFAYNAGMLTRTVPNELPWPTTA